MFGDTPLYKVRPLLRKEEEEVRRLLSGHELHLPSESQIMDRDACVEPELRIAKRKLDRLRAAIEEYRTYVSWRDEEEYGEDSRDK